MGLPPDAASERREIAIRVVDLARSGVINTNALRDRVLAEAKNAV